MVNSKKYYIKLCDDFINDNDFQTMIGTSGYSGQIYAYILLNLYLVAIKNNNQIRIPNSNPVKKEQYMRKLANDIYCNNALLEETLLAAIKNNIIKVYEDDENIIIDCYKLDGYVELENEN